jgi:hypothetical protein
VGSNYLQITVQATNGFSYIATTPTIPQSVLDSLSATGFRVNSAVVDMANLQVNTPVMSTNQHYLTLATNTVNDLLGHFWIGNAQTGQIVNTWNGYTNNLPDLRGGLWERGMFYTVLNDLRRVTGDPLCSSGFSPIGIELKASIQRISSNPAVKIQE